MPKRRGAGAPRGVPRPYYRHGVSELRSAIFQPLEERAMLDIGGANSLPPTIVVGRTLSAYDVPDVQNNQETLTFTVYNQAADPISGALLTDTLANGVTFASASQLPDQNGQQLAWSLGTIQPYDRANVTLTVTLASSLLGAGLPTPPQLDTGASAYGTLDAGMVSWTTAPASLRTTAVAANLLASTPDANTTDPYVQEKAAELNYDPTQIYAFLQTQIGYNSYSGSLRGARGTLWSNAGNSLDDASLGVALMRASGIPAQYEEGTLTTAQAQQLILSMFPAVYQTVGAIPAGTQTADPANDPQLLSETKDHYWFQFDAGSGMKDADPEFAGQAVGQTATTSSNNFTVVPDNLRAKTEVKLTAEIYDQAAALFGLSDGLSENVVLDQTFNDVDLVGHPLTVGNFVNSTGIGAIFTSVTNTYSPYISIGDDANPNSGQNPIIKGTDYQEVLTNLAFGNQVLTGLFLDVTTNGPGETPETDQHTILDRIGYAARQGLVPTSVRVSPDSAPALFDGDVLTLDIATSSEPQGPLVGLGSQEASDVAALNAAVAAAGPSSGVPSSVAVLNRAVSTENAELIAGSFSSESDRSRARDGAIGLSSLYLDSPRVVAVSELTKFDETTNVATTSVDMDILRDEPRAVASPGQAASATTDVLEVQGLEDSIIESNVLPPSNPASGIVTTSSMGIFSQALTQPGVSVLNISASNLQTLSRLGFSAEVNSRITAAVTSGDTVLVPSQSVEINGQKRVAWIQMNAAGNTIAVSDNGEHGAIISGQAAEEAPEPQKKSLFAQVYRQRLDAANAAEEAEAAAKVANIAARDAEGFANVTSRLDEFSKLAKWLEPDPPLSGLIFGMFAANAATPSATTSIVTSAGIGGGSVIATIAASAVSISGSLAASWTSAATSAFSTTGLSAAGATVSNGNSQVIGSGPIALLATAPISVAVSGSNQYQVTGTGSLSPYGPAESSLGVSGNWKSYSATISGNDSITLTVPAGALTLNAQPLAAGVYTITTSLATLSGSGSTASPNFAGSASITASGGAVELGAGSGSLSVGGTAFSTANETTLTGYSGTINVVANGNGTDAVTLNGNAANVLTVASTPVTLTTNQNSPASFNANILASFADTYNVTANAPTSWTVTIDHTGQVTVKPAPGTQSGTYPIQIIVQSATNPDLVSQATVEVTVTPTAPEMTLAVAPDPVFTVPFDGAQLPTAFRATMQNTGPAADTYKLTLSNVPSGFTLLNSGTSVTVPAGETGILGLYLQPTGTTLPPPGTNLSFTVTATSATNPAITQTVNVSFTMPTIDAVTVASSPASVTSTPGTPTTATVTITNVGNVTANAALSSTTDSGLTASGLPSAPVSVGIGKSTTETVTLTPSANAALNSTLNATISAGPAATADEVNVVSVDPKLRGGSASQSPAATGSPSGTAGATFFAGETVDVTADILAGVTNPRQALASYTVTNSSGTVVFTSTPVTIALGGLPADNAVDLGTMSTTGFAAGQYTINVAVTETGGQAIAGATGTGTLVIDSPITAGLSVDAEQVSPGTNTVTSTLSVANQPVIGSVQTDGTASSVAVNGTLAYVAGTKDINIVDLSDPSNPQIVGTFGSDKIASGNNSLVAVAGNDLIVATGVQSSLNGFTVLVYTLSNPKSPQFAGSVNLPFAGMAGMTVQGTTAYFATEGFLYDSSSGSISDQFGDVVAVDFSNATAPAVLGELFNDRAAPEGHSGAQWDFQPIAGGIAYVAGSTSTGPNTQTGTGQIAVVNTTNPSSLSVSSTLPLPGTVQALAIGVQGNTALVVGSSGGYLSPFGDPSNVHLTGNVTLTLLNISNPSQPSIIGSTVVTQNTFATFGESPLGSLQVVPLGNNQFAVNGTLLNGQFTVMTVDATTPTSPAISTFSENSQVSNLALAGGLLLATSANGLQVLASNALTTTSVTAEVNVPNSGATINLNSFSTPPTSITSGANSTALVWKLNIAPGDTQQITWQSTTSDLLPGQVEQVATGGSVQFTEDGTNQTLTLPPLNVVAIEAPQTVQIPVLVRSAQTVAISQASVDAGSAGNSQLSNTLSELSDTVSLLQAMPTDPNLLSRTQLLLNNLSSELGGDPSLAQFVSQLAPIQADAKNGDVTDMLAALPTFFKKVDQVLAVEAGEQFTVNISPSEVDLPALANQQKNLTVTVTDTGPDPVMLNLSTAALPTGVTATLGQTQLTLQPGASQNILLTLTSNLVSTSIFQLVVNATDSTDSTLATVARKGTAIVAVRAAAADVLGVTVNPISVTTAGAPIAVSASIFNTANAARSVEAEMTVLDSSNKPLGTPTTVPITLTPMASAVTFPLGNVDTIGLANGVYTLEVSLLASDGSALPGKTSEAPFLVGIPISASVSASPSTLPPGTSNVTTTITVANTDPPNEGTGNSAQGTDQRSGTTSRTVNTSTTSTTTQSQTNNPQSPTPNLQSPAPNFQPLTSAPPADPPSTPPTFAFSATGDNVKWIGAASGNWDVAANWLDTTTNTNHVPDATDNVTIDAAGLTVTVEAGSQVGQALWVKSGSTLTIAGGTLTLSDASEVDGTLDIAANNPTRPSALRTGGGLTLTGSTQWSGGTINLLGQTMTNWGTMTIANTVYLVSDTLYDNTGNTYDMGGSLVNEGTVAQQSGTFNVYENIKLDNTAQGTYQFTGDATLAAGDGTFIGLTNAGLIEKSGGTGTSTVTLPITAPGGTFESDSGTLTLAGAGSTMSGDTFNVGANATLRLAENAQVVNNPTLNIAQGGTFDPAGGQSVVYTGTIDATGAGQVLLSNGSMVAGAGGVTFNFPAGMFQWTAGAIDLEGNTLTNNGVLTLANASNVSLYANGQFNSSAGGNLGGTLINTGTIVEQGAGSLQMYDSVALNNAAGGVINFAGDAGIAYGNDSPSIANAGTMHKSAGSGTSTVAVGTANSSGTVIVDSGTLDLAGSLVASTGATFTVAAGATFNWRGTLLTGTYTGSGGGTITLANGDWVIGAGGVTFDFPAGMLQWTGGSMNLDGHTLANLGSITLNNAQDVHIYANGFFNGSGGSNLGGTFANQGSFVKQGAGSIVLYDSVLFDNQAAGTFNLTNNTGIAYGNDSPSVMNEGTLVTNAAGGIAAIAVAYDNNGGAVEVNRGTLQLSAFGTSTGGNFNIAAGATLDWSGGNLVTGTYIGSGGGRVVFDNGSLVVGAAGATLNFPAGMLQLTMPNNLGGIDLDGHTLTNVGAITAGNATTDLSLYANGNYPGGPGGTNLGGSLVNKGTITVATGSLQMWDDVTLDNQSTGTLTLAGDVGIALGNNAPQLTNEGTMTKSAGTGTTTIGVAFTNSGTFDVATGIVAFTNSVNNNGMLDAEANTLTISGALNNAGTIQTEGGSITLSGAVSNTGTLETNGGSITLNSSLSQVAGGRLTAGTYAALGGGTITLPTGTDVVYNQQNITLAGAGATITGFANLAINTGTLTLTDGADFGVAGNLANEGTVNIGPSSTLSIGGNYSQVAAGTLAIGLGGVPASGKFGTLAVTAAAFDGMLRAQLVEGYVPASGDSFTVATYASTSGSFAIIDMPGTSTVAFQAQVNPANIVLSGHAATLTPTTTTVTSSASNGANYGHLVEYTASVTAASGTPTGSVEFQIDGLNYGAPIALTGGQATLTVALPVGAHSIAAFYISGNTQFANSDDSASPLMQAVSPAAAVNASSIELYYTTYSPGTVDKVAVSYNQGSLTLGAPTTLAQVPADGLIVLPNGDLLAANGEASEVNPNTGAVTTETQVSGEHLALDPSGKYVWASPQPGALYKLPIDPLGPATQETLTGDDTSVTQLAFDPAGQAFYTSSGPAGYGDFGLIDLTTFTTQRIYSDLPSAHGITYDPFTGDLFLVGANSIDQIDPNTLKIVSELNLPVGGLDQGAEDGKGHLYVESGPDLVFVDYSATGLIGDPRNFVSTPFLENSLDDMAPLVGLGGAGIPVTVTHQLPATGYNVNPTSITPLPTSLSSGNVTWNTTFTPGVPETDQFELTGQATNMAPGEVREISTGTTVTATVTAADGTQIPVSINLPPVTVAAQHIIELTPPTETVDQGATATYTVELSNPLPTDETYTLSVTGLPSGETANMAASVPVPAGQTVDVPLTVSVPVGELQGTQPFLVSAQTLEGAFDSVEGQLTVNATVAVSSLAVNLTLTPTQAAAGQTNPAIYTLTVTNTGDTTDTYTLSGAFPTGFTGTFSQTTMTVPPGISNFRDIQLALTPPAGAAAQNYPFTVTATSTTGATVQSQASGTATVLAQGVQVELTPSSAVPGSTYQLKVTNTGQATDTFNLSLASPGALVSTLGTNQVTLQAGASQTVPVTTGAVNFADPGVLPLTGIATSQTNSSVQGQSTADLTIASTQSMTAAFTPAQQTLVVPAATSFLLEVNNTGNSEDSYSATIVGTTGPVTANLVGLDGQPTQSVPLFILPGLSTGAILLQVNDTGTGQGTVTVLVQSLTNSSIQAAPTATVTVAVPTTPPPTLTLTNDVGLAVAEGSSIALTNAMLQTTDSDSTVTAANIIYTVTAAPTQGTLSLGGKALAQGGTFTQDDINNGRVTYNAGEEGADSFGFSVAASGATGISGTFLIASSDPAVVTTGGFSITASEGASSAAQTVATFTDPGGFEPQASYTAEIHWGDGTSSAGTVILPAGTLTSSATVTGGHTYAEQGNYSISVIVSHEGAPAATATSTATVSDPAILASGGFTYAATVGTAAAAQTVAVFTDPGGAEPLADYAATIDWGDGTSATAGVLSVDPSTHIFTVSGQHSYTTADTYTVGVTLTHESAPAVTVTSAAQIAASSVTTPTLTLTNDTGLAVAEGASATLTGSMLETTDSDSSVAAANIVYTLTTAPTQGSLLLSGQPLSKGSTFTQGDINNGRVSYAATEEGADAFGFSVAAGTAAGTGGTFQIAISDPAVAANGDFTYTATAASAGASHTVAVFTDPGGAEALADYAATIDWGDGTSAAAGAISVDSTTHVFTVNGQHSYAQAGTFTVQVKLTHEEAPAVSVNSSAIVANATITGSGGIVATAVPLTGYEFSTPTSVTVATFTDGDDSLPAGDFSATINWGDGSTSAGGVSVSATGAGGAPTPQYSVSGAHQYHDEGTYTIHVAISQSAGPTTGGASSATVSATANIHEQLLSDGTAGSPNQNYIQEIYRDMFSRQAEPTGLADWVGLLASGVPRATVAYEMVKVATSEEFQIGTVNSLYQQYLHRAPDPTGQKFWVAYLYSTGGTIEGMAEALIGSDEYFQVRGGGTVSGFLHALFQDVLGRPIDSGALAYFSGRLASGQTTYEIASMVFGSAEYERLRVNDLYEQLLDRPAEPAALASFTVAMADGMTDESIIARILSSDEYFARSQQ